MKPIIFFDDGGVLNSNQLREDQWKLHVADFMVDKFGGEHAKWMQANVNAITKMFDFMNKKSEAGEFMDYKEYRKLEAKLWVENMFIGADLQLPPEKEYDKILSEADEFVIPKIRSAYPNIVESIKILYKNGYTLNTASGASEHWLKLFLEPMGILHCFKTVYGKDLVDCMKSSPVYYERIFKREGILPSQAIIIDDSVKFLKFVQNLGTKVIQSCLDGQQPILTNYITDANQIPDLIYKMENNHFLGK